MAQLILVPNPVVMAVQSGVFVVGAFIIKELMIKPYLSIRDRQQKLTSGNKEEALEMIAQCEVLSKALQDRLQRAAQEAQKTKELIRSKAVEKRQTLLGSAEKEAAETLTLMAQSIKEASANERAKIPAVVQRLTQEVFDIVLQ